ncbi:hypothetical protein CAOG_06137 [Capsaspora owczarzaki ATCC 30864]|uniref:Uncharacterized protein n=1 Tax=Capsaspora owczarzaki (strain ATCC 30864) TaxID=595528 RepID=A0A0D2WTE7_CAPO3|nr:hypothetical protein CAOG_06137 [Capsaspora owczarzaki ATCC 30864]KJE95715.1 hypothetical protein CAOG_006137 [Capsaspora owczarzaki ATCC 30864]|eukprot:XP_004345727.1 hypothetical protein CAOG_06137 [Capsaspora owczarzaki ATCC 30864]
MNKTPRATLLLLLVLALISASAHGVSIVTGPSDKVVCAEQNVHLNLLVGETGGETNCCTATVERAIKNDDEWVAIPTVSATTTAVDASSSNVAIELAPSQVNDEFTYRITIETLDGATVTSQEFFLAFSLPAVLQAPETNVAAQSAISVTAQLTPLRQEPELSVIRFTNSGPGFLQFRQSSSSVSDFEYEVVDNVNADTMFEILPTLTLDTSTILLVDQADADHFLAWLDAFFAQSLQYLSDPIGASSVAIALRDFNGLSFTSTSTWLGIYTAAQAQIHDAGAIADFEAEFGGRTFTLLFSAPTKVDVVVRNSQGSYLGWMTSPQSLTALTQIDATQCAHKWFLDNSRLKASCSSTRALSHLLTAPLLGTAILPTSQIAIISQYTTSSRTTSAITDSTYSIGSGATSSAVGVWSSRRCQQVGTSHLQSLLECAAQDDNPTYRQVHIELGAFGFGIKYVTVDLTHYPLPYPVDGPSAAILPRQSGHSTSTKSRLELWVALAPSGTWIDVTDSVTEDFTRDCVSRGQRQRPCRVTFDVLEYLRASDTILGNQAISDLRLVFDGIEPSSLDLDAAYRYFGISEVQAIGTCICNGHSSTCNYATGQCTGCEHHTQDDTCGSCDNTHWENRRNSLPAEVVNCDLAAPAVDNVLVCDGPALADIDVSELESLFFESGGRSGVIVPGVSARDLPSAIFSKFFATGGACVLCNCHNHSLADAGQNVRGCDASTGVCNCDPTTETTGDHCESCQATWCRSTSPCNNTPLSSSDLYACRLQSCSNERCDCNGHSTLPQVGGFDQCDGNGCGCSCNPADGVTGPHCESCLPGHFSSTGDGVDGETCEPCFCNGHKGSPETCDVSGGNCDQAGDPCQDNTTGFNCELCLDGFYRPFRPDGSIDPTDDCIPCACNGHGVGPALCNPNGGVCDCDPASNSEGDQCQSCIVGFWSATGNAESGTSCSACECNGHKDYVSNECNALGGDCMTDFSGAPQPCDGNTNDFHCQGCVATFFRPCTVGVPTACSAVDYTDDCSPCDCNGHSVSPIGGLDTCNAEGGLCTCTSSSNSEGDSCENCKPNTWNDFGNSEDGRDCAPCACYGHSATCSNFGVCSGCQGNTEGNNCEQCVASNSRVNPAAFVGWDLPTPDPAVITTMREQDCTPCNCNGHSLNNPTIAPGICTPELGICLNCGGNTANGAANECDTCVPGFFRQLTSAGFDPASDTCNACSLVDGDCTSDALTDACRPCSEQCFGANTMCGADTGICQECALSHAESHRCASCQNGYFGNPAGGIPCTPCKCYHSAPSKFDLLTETEIGTFQQCLFDNSLGGVSGGAQTCIFDHSVNPDDAAADPQSAILCSCPRSIPGGFFNIISSGVVYEGRTCDSCNQDAYFGQPTQCLTPGVGGSGLGDCLSFDTCNECICNGNIDESSMMDNCDYSAGNPSNLICEACLGHSTGPNCEVCEVGYYGDPTRLDTPGTIGTGFILDASGESLKCFQCDCNGHSIARVVPGTEGDVHNDTCTTVAPGFVGNYTCDCDSANGYTGPTCRECLLGYEQIALGGNLFRCDPCDNCTRDAAAIIYGLIADYQHTMSLSQSVAASTAAIAAEITAIKDSLGLARRDADAVAGKAATIIAFLPTVQPLASDDKARSQQLNDLLEAFDDQTAQQATELTAQLAGLLEDASQVGNMLESPVVDRLHDATSTLANLLARNTANRDQLVTLETSLESTMTAFASSSNWLSTHLQFAVDGREELDAAAEGLKYDRAEMEDSVAKPLNKLTLVWESVAAALEAQSSADLMALVERAGTDALRRLDALAARVSKLGSLTNQDKVLLSTNRDTLAELSARATLLEADLANKELEQSHAIIVIALGGIDQAVRQFAEQAGLAEDHLMASLRDLDPAKAPHVTELVERISTDLEQHRTELVDSSAAMIQELRAASAAAFATAQTNLATVQSQNARLMVLQSMLELIDKAAHKALSRVSDLLAGSRISTFTAAVQAGTESALSPLERQTFNEHGNKLMATAATTLTLSREILDNFYERHRAMLVQFGAMLNANPVQVDRRQVQFDMSAFASVREELGQTAKVVAVESSDALHELQTAITSRAGALASMLQSVNVELSRTFSSIRAQTFKELTAISATVDSLPSAVAMVARGVEDELAAFADESERQFAVLPDVEADAVALFVAAFRAEVGVIRERLTETNLLVSAIEQAIQVQADILDGAHRTSQATLQDLRNMDANVREFLSLPPEASLTTLNSATGLRSFRMTASSASGRADLSAQSYIEFLRQTVSNTQCILR